VASDIQGNRRNKMRINYLGIISISFMLMGLIALIFKNFLLVIIFNSIGFGIYFAIILIYLIKPEVLM